ncbi:MAG TPA: 50S ribosomal protein L11 methyltransferase [Methylomirabilota bacterium]
MSRYWELSVSVPDDAAEGLTNFVWELGALGVVEEDTPGGGPRLRAFFSDLHERDELAARVRDYLGGLQALGFGTADDPLLAPVADENWAEAWRQHFRPLAVGRGLVIAPPWETPPPNGRLAVTIEPGRAFGTGHHATTSGCLAALEAIVERSRPERALDLGTGSGILAITAARLGVVSVLAVDADPDAIASAIANAARNGVCDRVRCLLVDAGAVIVPPVPLVLANLMKPAHLRLAPAYMRYVAPGGALVLGGILEADADCVSEAMTGHGFVPRAITTADGWATLELERVALPPRAH